MEQLTASAQPQPVQRPQVRPQFPRQSETDALFKTPRPMFLIVFSLIAGALVYVYFVDPFVNVNLSGDSNVAEGFSAGSITSLTKSVGNMSNTVSNLPKEMDQKIDAMGKKIQKQTMNAMTSKLTSFTSQFGDVMYDSIVQPILVLLEGIGDIFLSLFSVIGAIGLKIAMLPLCLVPYMFGEIGSVIGYVYNAAIPSLIRVPIGVVYDYTLGPIFSIIGYITGISWLVGKCYSFNINGSLNAMKGDLGRIQKEFKQNFGKFDFSKIKV